MPTEEWKRGYDDGLQEGERRGWEKGTKAAAMAVDSSLVRKNITDALSELIRELKP